MSSNVALEAIIYQMITISDSSIKTITMKPERNLKLKVIECTFACGRLKTENDISKSMIPLRDFQGNVIKEDISSFYILLISL